MDTAFNQKILLVDDRPENILVLENILEGPNREFVKANSGEEALSLLLKDDISLILLDVQMPGLDGFETAKLIVGTERTKRIPIIFVTAISREQRHIFQGYEAGAVDYLKKPLEPEIVQSKVKIFLELDGQRRLLEMQNEELIHAKKNTDNILANVEEGLFLINREYEIMPQYSVELERTLEQDQLAGINLLTLLKDSITEEFYNNTCMYLELMFRDDIDEKLIDELNPLNQIQYHSASLDSEGKYLSFKFKRVFSNGGFNELIATVTDNTKQILLAKKLEETEEKSKIQLELLNIIHSEPLVLKEFLVQTQKELSFIQEKLNKKEDKDSFTTFDKVYQSIHSVKGNAALLKFSFVAEKAHKFEEVLISIKERPSQLIEKTKLFESLLKDMFFVLDEMNFLIAKMASFNDHFNAKSGNEGELLINAAQNILEQLGKDLDKKVKLDPKEFKINSIPPGNYLLIKDILVQLSRNAMYHGIETKAERKKQKKTLMSTISLASKISKNELTLIFKDDGRGLQIDRIKEKAIESGQWTKDKLVKWTDEQIADLIFVSGVSTADKSDFIAGRGIGMSIIKQKIEQLGGNLAVNSEFGKYCQFTISLPLTAN